MHSNGTLPLDMPLDAPLAARCGSSLKNSIHFSANLKKKFGVSNFLRWAKVKYKVSWQKSPLNTEMEKINVYLMTI